MPLCIDYNLLFIHIPKTGGQSIEKALGVYGPSVEKLWGDITLDGKTKSGQHLSLVDIEKYIGHDKFST